MDQHELPIRTFIPTHVGDARENWYKAKKKPLLEKWDTGTKVPEHFIIPDVKVFIADVKELIGKDNNLGVYFGAETERKADIVLLFAGVKKWSNLLGTYYLLNKKGHLEKIDIEKAHVLRNNYQNGVQPVLEDSTGDGYTDTEYVYFEKDIIAEILGEINYQADEGRIDGLKVRLIAYADKKTESTFFTNGSEPKYLQRLSIMFTYTKGGQDTSFEQIDPARYAEVLNVIHANILDSGLDSGRPIPPYPPKKPVNE